MGGVLGIISSARPLPQHQLCEWRLQLHHCVRERSKENKLVLTIDLECSRKRMGRCAGCPEQAEQAEFRLEVGKPSGAAWPMRPRARTAVAGVAGQLSKMRDLLVVLLLAMVCASCRHQGLELRGLTWLVAILPLSSWGCLLLQYIILFAVVSWHRGHEAHIA